MSGNGSGYAELHCHTNFSFLDGASHPEELAEEAAPARAGGAGASPTTTASTAWSASREAARDARAADRVRRGADARDRPGPPNGERRSRGRAPARARRGPGRATPRWPGRSARRSCGGEGRAAHHGRRSWPTRPARRCTSTGSRARATTAGSCSPGAARARCPRRSCATAPPRPRTRSSGWSPRFGRDRVLVELWDHGDPLDRHRNDALARVAMRGRASRWSPPTTCTTPRPAQRPLATALAAVRARRSLDEIDGWLPAAPFAHLRSAAEQAPPLRALARARSSAPSTSRATCAFDLRLAAPEPARLRRARRPHRDDVAARAHRARRGASATRRRTRSTSRRCARSTTSST